MSKSYELGKTGEQISAEYLTKKGYKIIEKNFECCFGEIDIIAIDKNELVFIEVKTRTDMSYGEAAEAVTPIKLQHLLNSIKYYIYKRALTPRQLRRFQKDPQKWYGMWFNQAIESMKELQEEDGLGTY